MKRQVDLMLDSGAFTMWNRGINLDCGDYIKWLLDHRDLLYSYVVLDIIPGAYGRKPTEEERIVSAEGSYRNQQLMRDAGLSPIPVFHQHEDFKYLEKYLRDGEPYIGAATNKSTSVEDQADWLDNVFTALTDSKGKPFVKLHGFGITRPSLVMRYPWFSTDSTTWTLTPSFGQLWVPIFVDGKPNYHVPPMQVVMSDVVRLQKANSRQVASFERLMMGAVREWLDYCGMTLEQARYDPNARRWIMLIWFTEFTKQWKVGPFRNRGASFSSIEFADPPINWKATGKLQIHLATNLSRNWADMMIHAGARHRLLNYHDLRTRSSKVLENYVIDGTVGKARAQPQRSDWRARYTTHRRMKLLARIEQYQREETNAET